MGRRRTIQPFREDTEAGECESCLEKIFSGDLAYKLEGRTYCMTCVRDAAFIAACDEDVNNERMMTDEHFT